MYIYADKALVVSQSVRHPSRAEDHLCEKCAFNDSFIASHFSVGISINERGVDSWTFQNGIHLE